MPHIPNIIKEAAFLIKPQFFGVLINMIISVRSVGTMVIAMAVCRSNKSVKTGVATTGSPMPLMPLANPATSRANTAIKIAIADIVKKITRF